MNEYTVDDARLHADRYGGWTLSWTAPDGTQMSAAFVPASVEQITRALGLVRVDAVRAAFVSRGLLEPR